MNWTDLQDDRQNWHIGSIADVGQLECQDLGELLESKTTWSLLQQSEQKFPDLPALTFIGNGTLEAIPHTWTYSEFVGEVRRAANLFSALNGTSEASVSIILPNLPETHFTLWGAEAAASANPINPFLEEANIANIMREAGSHTVVTIAEHVSGDLFAKVGRAAQASGCIKRLITVDPSKYLENSFQRQTGKKLKTSGLEILSYESAIKDYSTELASFNCEIEPGTTASKFHTGGTTGLPKLAKHSHLNEAYQGWVVSRFAGFQPGDTILCGLPLFHVNAGIVTGLASFAAGSHVLLATPEGYRNRTFMKNIWKFVERYKVTAISGVPTFYAGLLDVPRKDEDTSTLKIGFCGAAPMSPELFRKTEEKLGLRLVEAYGLTEGGCVSTANPIHGEAKIGSVGLRLPFQNVAIARLNEDHEITEFCKANEVGAVVVKGPNVFPGYTDESRNQGVLTSDGWLVTGDVGKLDEDGFLWLTGRAKDLIIRGGHNIDPAAIEDPLSSHPDVALAAAVGKPDGYAGELPVAFVQLRPGADIDEETLRQWIHNRISDKAALPARIDILEQMPLTAVGKIYKPDLRIMAVKHALKDIFAEQPFNTVDYEVGMAKTGQISVKLKLNENKLPRAISDELSAWPIPVDIQ